MKSLILFSLSLALAASASAKNGVISVAHMMSYQAEYDYYIEAKDGSHTKAGSWSDLIEISDDTISRTVTRRSLQGSPDLIRTVVADKHTLSPVFLNQRFGANLEGVFYTHYQDRSLQQIYIANSRVPARTLDAQLNGEVQETNLQGIFAAALPLSGQTDIQVTGYSAGAEPGLKPTRFSVGQEELININNEQLSARKVTDPASGWTYWVRSEFPYLVKVAHPSQDGQMLVSLLTRFEALE